MNQKLQSIFTLAERDRLKMLALVKNIEEKDFFNAPVNKWCISQVLSHLIMAERLSLQYMKKKSLGINAVDDSGWWEEMKFMILKFSQRVPIKYKAPKVLGESQPPTLPYTQLEQQWQAVRDELKSFVFGMNGDHIKRKIYKHPVSGRLNVLHAIAFFREHANHHLPQIKRLLP